MKINKGMPVKELEKELEEAVNRVEFWGDLEIENEEIIILRDKIRAILENSKSISLLCNSYPHLITTYMVFFVRYYLDINFWGLLGEELNKSLSQIDHNTLGNCARCMFIKHNLDFSDAEAEARKNIAPIVYEACLPPESGLSDLFYVLSYDKYNVFDPQLVIEDLIEMRSYTIRKPMLRFLKRFKDQRAIDFVVDVRDAMISANQSMSHSNRYAKHYLNWKEKERSSEVRKNRRDKEYQTKPYLVFDNNSKGLCIVLPRAVMEYDWIEEAKWIIRGKNGFEKNVICNVVEEHGLRCTQAIAVPVVPDEQYQICLEDGEFIEKNLSSKWDITGIDVNKITIFNANGRLTNGKYLQYPYGIIIVPEAMQLIANHIDLVTQIYPNNSEQYNVYCATPSSNRASLKCIISDVETDLYLKPQINMELSGKMLFGVNSSCFTELPTLNITNEMGEIVSDLKLKICDEYFDIKLDENGCASFNLRYKTSHLTNKYGTYSIKLYHGLRLHKQLEFDYVPKIKTNYLSSYSVIKENLRSSKEYKFYKLDDWEMSFSNCVVKSYDDYYLVESFNNCAYIGFELSSIKQGFKFGVNLTLPTRPLELFLVNSSGEVVENVTDRTFKIDIEDDQLNDLWLSINSYVEHGDARYRIEVRTINGVEQIVPIYLSKKGACNIDFSVLYDTIHNCTLPAQINIVNDELVIPFLLINEKMSLEVKPSFAAINGSYYLCLNYLDEGKDIEVSRFGFNRQVYQMPYSKSKWANKNTKLCYEYPNDLVEGIYIVKCNKEQSAFVFEDETIEALYPNNNIIFCELKNNQISGINSRIWLKNLILQVLKQGNKGSIREDTAYALIKNSRLVSSIEILDFRDIDIEYLVALAYFVNSKISKENKQCIRECMKFISVNFLRRGDRYRIIELLMELKCPQQVFDICLSEYSLLLFYDSNHDKAQLASLTEEYSTELSMLLLMSNDSSIRECISKDKYRSLIGKEAIKYMLDVPREDNPEEITKQQKLFISEKSSSKVRINISGEITGDENVVISMFTEDYEGNPSFDISKKTNSGISFANIRYEDQYVNWYKNTHDKKSNMNEVIREALHNSVKRYYTDVIQSIKTLTNDDGLGKSTKKYLASMNQRWDNRITDKLTHEISYPLYFMLQGLAAYLACLPSKRTDLDEYRKIGIRFMSEASFIAPRLSKRDILLASTYLYLIRKEEKLCR